MANEDYSIVTDESGSHRGGKDTFVAVVEVVLSCP